MSAKPPLFRAEALAHHVRGVGEGGPVRYGRRWTGPGFLALLVLFCVAFAAAALIRIEPTVSGPAAIDDKGRRLVAVLPVSAVTPIRQGRSVELDTDTRTITLPASALAVKVVDRSSAAKALGSEPTKVPGEEVAVLRARVPPAARAPARARRVRIVLPGERLLSVLLTGFDGDA